ncbi:CRISPR-associated endonuclease Cas4/Cas1 [Mycobacterium shinjukuense]|uniref:CRISPR-associated endonuclease Cas1 n=1 Tax=Mycobacterium shinjukuense TaxID=398694 RepID=A0A7I7MPG6_9MYCO|nr:CRISPR-associated endonuclease Cas4/Cas1 [Mycobacterium shinjukuense]MCV6987216.1 CRISPR-associated endonuclease Cas4/Cas1 [Mycobacterium shinjukuense]ORB63536.1 CRISPR-associated endonuclease Cas4/Cas1 [Mycobacterium shinjukuense]BBX73996.1 CRISPR-associated exonuclease Cas4/endonuclease Cas1 fusion [Mycobacterium shinjukuense]
MTAPDPLPISLVSHHVFCPRRAWLEAAGEQTDTYQMSVGELSHRATDNPANSRGGRHRSVDIAHPAWGITGRADAVEDHDGSLRVVEYKATPVRREAEPTDTMRVQLALQSACLEAMGHTVVEHGVYFTTHHKYVPVALSTKDFDAARAEVSKTRATLQSSTAPAPLEDDPRCMRCSHVGVCLPEERAQNPVIRRIHAADPDSQIIHLATSGSRASIRHGRLCVSARGEEVASFPLERVSGLVVHGNIDLSSALIRELLWRGLTIVWCSGTGRVIGWGHTANTPNGLARVRQHQASAEGRLALAREFIGAKIANQATLLRRNGDAPATVSYLRMLQRTALSAETLGALYGFEGEAAARYFASFSTMLRPRQAEVFLARWPGRAGRGALDPLNVALNFVYGVLVAETIRAVAACGLDPHAGFLHSSNRNKPALALDLMEEFRAPLGDAVVLTAINNGEITESGFSSALGSCRLRDSGRKALLSAYERRLATEFTHPVFKYKVTWRRAIEVQARMVLGYIDGSQAKYTGVATR